MGAPARERRANSRSRARARPPLAGRSRRRRRRCRTPRRRRWGARQPRTVGRRRSSSPSGSSAPRGPRRARRYAAIACSSSACSASTGTWYRTLATRVFPSAARSAAWTRTPSGSVPLSRSTSAASHASSSPIGVVHELDHGELVAALDAHGPRQGQGDDRLGAHALAQRDLAAHAPEGGEQHVHALQVREVAGSPADAEAELDLQALCRGRRRLRPTPAGSARGPCTRRSRCSRPTGSRR